jgi:hypothetical protein
MAQSARTEPEMDPNTQRSLSQVLHLESRHYVAPFWWGTDPFDANSVCANGSCFFVEIGDARFGVTAYHVVTAYLRCREAHPSTRLVVRNVALTDWETRFIDGNAECDVATFRVSDAEFQAINVRALRWDASRWPPPPPMVGRGVFFTGYPEVDRRVLRRNAVEFLQQSNGLVAASVEPDEIEVVADPAYLDSGHGQQPTPTTKNLSGYSGAPLLVVSAALGPPFWLGGVVINQMHARTEDQPTHIWARRPGCILADGSLRKPRHVLD